MPQRLILALCCFDISRGTVMAEELETAQIPPHIMAAMRERMKMAQRMSRIKHKIVVMSGKGGVGKSSVAANLACVLAEDGSVGLVDADVTGPDIPMLMGVQDAQVKATETGMEPTVGPAGVKVISMAQLIDRDTAVVWRGPLKIKALKQMLSDVEGGDLDYLVIDLPPRTNSGYRSWAGCLWILGSSLGAIRASPSCSSTRTPRPRRHSGRSWRT